MTTRGRSLKDELFNAPKLRWLATQLSQADTNFAADDFVAEIMADLPALELKQRIALIADVLARYLPDGFQQAADLIDASLPPELDPTRSDDDFGDFIFAPLGEYVALNGCNTQNLDRALISLHALTRRFSMEWAIRPFLQSFPDQTFAVLDLWVSDDHYHVRRLVSEGTRPRLPWAARVNVPLARRLAWLDQLHADPTRYVTRSVANHLNDISKENIPSVINSLKRWSKDRQQTPKELDWITRHALRTSVKSGDPAALALLGYEANPPISANIVLSKNVVTIGEALELDVSLTAHGDARLLIDYLLELPGARGPKPPKVFKLKSLRLAQDETLEIGKRHPLRGDATTYSLHPGPARVTLQINGQPGPSCAFTLAAGD